MGDPLEELRKISASEQQETRGEGEAVARAAAKEREREQRKDAARAASAAKAPHVLHSMRFFGAMFVGMLIATVFGVIALEGDWWDWRVTGPIAGAWGLVTALLVLDGVTWKRLLPFELVGFEFIGGKDDTGSDRVAWIAFELSIDFAAAGERAPLVRTMEILGSRINRAMQSDKEANFSGAKVWRVNEDGVLKGEASQTVFTTRLFEKWLRREVRLLHRAFPISTVHFKAKYTGSSYATSSD